MIKRLRTATLESRHHLAHAMDRPQAVAAAVAAAGAGGHSSVAHCFPSLAASHARAPGSTSPRRPIGARAAPGSPFRSHTWRGDPAQNHHPSLLRVPQRPAGAACAGPSLQEGSARAAAATVAIPSLHRSPSEKALASGGRRSSARSPGGRPCPAHPLAGA
eukprot:scaffold301_cov243-Pinguiococcus_pyrenoidosus.AAC.3